MNMSKIGKKEMEGIREMVEEELFKPHYKA